MDFTEDELRALYQKYAPVLLHRCRSILKNEEAAQDAVQETFARVIRNADDFRSQSSPMTWMYRISTNYCLNQIRNRKTRTGKLEHHRDDIVGAGVTSPTDRTDAARMMDLLESADEQTRRCVIHTYFDDCTREEVAQLVGISVPTVRKRINSFIDRARRQFGTVALVGTALVLVSWSLQ